MTIPISRYSKIYNKYCLCYLGPSKEILDILIKKRSDFEKQFKEIEIHIACRDNLFYLLDNKDRILSQSELKENKNNFAYIREVLFEMNVSPEDQIEKL